MATDTTAGELVVIGIDNSWILGDLGTQIDATKIYAKHIIESHPHNLVGVLTMSQHSRCSTYVWPTRDLDEILRAIQNIKHGGYMEFTEGIEGALQFFSYGIKNAPFPSHYRKRMKKRMLVFTGSDVDMLMESADDYGTALKERGVAVDVVHFSLGNKHKFCRSLLDTFVDAANNNDNSRIIQVKPGSSVSDILSSFCEKIAGDEYVEAQEMKNKDHQLTTNSYLKKTSRLSRKKKNQKKAMKYGKSFPLILEGPQTTPIGSLLTGFEADLVNSLKAQISKLSEDFNAYKTTQERVEADLRTDLQKMTTTLMKILNGKKVAPIFPKRMKR